MRIAARKRTPVAAVIILLLLVLVGAVLLVIKLTAKEPDPHEGQVLVNDGFEDVWITPLAGVDASIFTEEDFTAYGQVDYLGDDFTVRRGIDVSEHQQTIDWAQVASSGVEFAFIRVAFRGTSVGGLFEDEYFRENLAGAKANGLDVGVYLFSQAINVQEAIEEAEYLLELLDGCALELPVIFDWEKEDGYRNADIGYDNLTDFAVAFCGTVENAGYQAGVYFGKQLGYYSYDLTRLTNYVFWLTDPGYFPDFYYAQSIWQYSFEETVPGIESPTDMNLMFIPRPAETDGEAKESS